MINYKIQLLQKNDTRLGGIYSQETCPTGDDLMQFNDGTKFELSGDLRIVRHPDGLHIIGDGILFPINSVAEGRELIAAVRERRTLKTETGA
jgi:hypothetical protein